MLYRRFGRTEISLPVLSCGGMRYQHSWKAGDPATPENQQNLEACIRRALELGIHHIETARGYGTSEEQLGKILPTLPRDQLIVQTKVSPTADPAEFESHFAESLQRLGLEYVDLFALHGLNNREVHEWAVRPGGCLERALEWKRQGRVRHVGFSTHAPADLVLEGVADGRFDYVNLHHYYVFQDNQAAIEEARRRDLGVFIISPTNKGGKLESPSPKLRELTAPLSPIVFNDLWCLAHPEIHTLSVGVARPSDFDEHAKAVETLAATSDLPALLDPIVARLRAELERALGAEWLERWREGLPPWEQMPGEINVREILRLGNLARALDLIEYGKMRYNLLGHGDHWFPGNRADRLDELDPQAVRAALAGSPFPDQVVEALRETHRLLAGEEVKRLQQDP